MESLSLRAMSAILVAFLLVAPTAGAVTSPQPALHVIVPGEVASRLLALDCERLEGHDARALLAQMPAPRIVSIQGSIPIVTMEAFARFLIAMGYPEAQLRDPADGALTQSSFVDSDKLAGIIAWHYERDGLRPMLIGHSGGGMLVIRTLHELAGAFHGEIPVFDPVDGVAQPRTTIRDPYSDRELPVVGLKVSFAAALATGTLPRVLLGQWTMIPLLRKVPDTVVEFTGFAIAWDPIAGNVGAPSPYVATGTAQVRNVLLPVSYTHIGLPRTEHLAAQRETRSWIDAYRPSDVPPPPSSADADTGNLLHAADLWFSIRRHWCLEGQQLLRRQGHS